jgi:TolB protein
VNAIGVRIVLTLAAAAALVGIVAGAGRASFPGSSGRIFFTAQSGVGPNPEHVYSVSADGSGLTQLTSGPGRDLGIAVSPADGHVVVSRDTLDQCGHLFWRGGYDLFALGADGSSTSRLTDDCPVDEATPAWSPSGRHLAVSRGGSIWLLGADASNPVRLTCTGTDSDFWPDWSPDGRSIVFDRVNDVYLMNADGTGQRRIATGAAPSFSPDGTRIAYGGGLDGAPGIHVVNIDGTGDVRLTNGPDGLPVWSPDGTKIAFVRALDPTIGPNLLETMNADGSGVTTLVDSLRIGSVDWARLTGPTVTEPAVTASETPCPEAQAQPAPAPGESSTPPPAAGPRPASIDASTVEPPDRLLVATVAFKPQLLRSRKPFVVSVAVRNRAGEAVRGADVQITPVSGAARPTGQLRTNPQGAASLRVTPTSRLRLHKDGRLVLAVRVRRPGAPWSGDSSGLRLVSVRTAQPATRR